MAWTDRIREAAYTSPSGTRYTYAYESVRRQFDRNAATFNPANAEGTLVQDLGRSGRRYPMRMIVWGEDYDQEAEALENALAEPGRGVLEHPIYGRVEVIPVGTVDRRDDLTTAANQAVVEVTFYDVGDIPELDSARDPSQGINDSLDAYTEASAANLEATAALDTVGDRATFRGLYEKGVETVRGGLQGVASVTAEVRREFDRVYTAVSTSVDTLIAEPLTLAFETMRLVQAPARATALLTDRLDAYGNLADSVVNQLGSDITPRRQNKVASTDLIAGGALTGSILSAANAEYQTRGKALAAAETVIDQLDTFTAWRDSAFNDAEQPDPGGSIQALTEAVNQTAGFLIQLSFGLQVERAVVLDRDRTVIDLASELYGGVDEYVDLIISSNELTGAEILELPRGRRIVYYV